MGFHFLGIDHVQLAVPQGGEDLARGFYVGVLGMVEEPKPPALAARGGCWFRSPGLSLHVGVDPHFTPATKAHPALLIDDLSALTEVLGSHGIPFREDDEIHGLVRGYVHDPFGNRIEIIEHGGAAAAKPVP